MSTPLSAFSRRELPPYGDDGRIATAASALLALHERRAAQEEMLATCERLMAVAERELLRRERVMMALGDDDLAAHVRRHGDILLKLGRQLRDLRRGESHISPHFLRFVRSLRELDHEARPD